MPEHTFEVEAYDVDLYLLGEGSRRSLRLEGVDPDGHDAVGYLNFFDDEDHLGRAEFSRTDDAVAVVADLPLDAFDQLYHVLQTEQPLALYVEYVASADPLCEVTDVGLTSSLEMVGEGFEDVAP